MRNQVCLNKENCLLPNSTAVAALIYGLAVHDAQLSNKD